jgi:hypothetical protein
MKCYTRRRGIYWSYVFAVSLLLFILSLGGYFSYEAYEVGNIGGVIGIVLCTISLIGCIMIPALLSWDSDKDLKKRSNSDLEFEKADSQPIFKV